MNDYLIPNNGVMSNAFSFATPLLTPRGAKTKNPQMTIAYQSAVECKIAFEDARPGLPFRYEIATGYSDDPEWQELFCDTVEALQDLDMEVSLFLLPGPQGKSIQKPEHFDPVVEHLTGAAKLVNDSTSIDRVSILPYGWKDDVTARPFRGKRRDAVIKNVAAVINAVQENVNLEFELLFESLSGRPRPHEPALEIPIFNQPGELLDLLEALNQEIDAGLVVDWAHLLYGAETEREAFKRIAALVELI
jgi:hypothetical protein